LLGISRNALLKVSDSGTKMTETPNCMPGANQNDSRNQTIV